MTAKERNDYFYVCALIEYIARETLNHRGDIVKAIGEEGIKKLLHDAEMDHCLSFEQVSDEVISYYKIKKGFTGKYEKYFEPSGYSALHERVCGFNCLCTSCFYFFVPYFISYDRKIGKLLCIN